MLDPGHGGENEGAIGVSGIKEKEVALDIALRTRHLLQRAGFEVVMTRSVDKDISLLDRSKLANKYNVDLLVSIHANSSPTSKTASGIETFIGEVGLSENSHNSFMFCKTNHDKTLSTCADAIAIKKQYFSKSLATEIQTSLLHSVSSNHLKVANRGVKRAGFLVITRGAFPSALVEVGFVSNEMEAKRLGHQSYRQLLAQGISSGIKRYIVETYKG